VPLIGAAELVGAEEAVVPLRPRLGVVIYMYTGPSRVVSLITHCFTALLVLPVAFLPHDLPGCLAMTSPLDRAPTGQSVITETYGKLDILVPESLREHSTELLENQKRAIDLGAVSDEDVDSLIREYEYLGYIFEEAPHCCWHLNIPPVRREDFHTKYPNWIPVSLVVRKRFIVAGAVAVSAQESYFLPSKSHLNRLDIDWLCLKRYQEE
jgi:hypothetical protein